MSVRLALLMGLPLAGRAIDLSYEPYDWSLDERPVSGRAPAVR